MKKALFVLLFAAVALGVKPNSAKAVKPFFDEFKAKYVKVDGDAGDKEFAALVDKAKCNVCHFGKEKKNRNDYGKALDKLLDKKKDIKDKVKIQKALDTVAEEKSAAGPTFGELIKEHKLPGTEEK
ncbi:MAG TPA: hypothetical protein VMV10_20775 [Pirellulales bacterium]|nr:hypothetical protein [Pirellulales bacterium]